MPNDYKNWVEDQQNGLMQKKEIENFDFAILYKPIDYIVATELNNKVIIEDSVEKRQTELGGYKYFTFRISSKIDNEFFKTGLQSENEYYQRLEYFVSNAQDDMQLVVNNDTIPCALYHFERNYGVSPYTSIVLAFESNETESKGDNYFIYDDKVLGVGKVVIKFKSNDISDLPHLNY